MNDPGPYYRPPMMTPASRPFRWLPVVIGVVLAGVAAFLLLLLLFPSAFGVPSPSYPDRFGLFGGFFLLFFVLIIVFFIVRVAFWSTRASRYGRRYGGNPGMNRPVAIARMRYARGEITREQYEQIMKDLGRPPSAP